MTIESYSSGIFSYELNLIKPDRQFESEKRKAFERLESINLNIPEDFDADEELRLALEEKYGSDDWHKYYFRLPLIRESFYKDAEKVMKTDFIFSEIKSITPGELFDLI